MSNPGRRFLIDGEYLTVAEIAKRAGITGAGVRVRIARGVRGRDLLAARVANKGWAARPKPTYEVGRGRKVSAEEAAARFGVNRNTFRARHQRGVRGAKLFQPPTKGQVVLSRKVVAQLDAYAAEHGLTRAEAVERMLAIAGKRDRDDPIETTSSPRRER